LPGPTVFQFLIPFWQFSKGYNFFTSYNGHSVCDALAAQAKRKVKYVIQETQQGIYDANKLAATINQVHGHQAIPISFINRDSPQPNTLTGIKSFHKFIFLSAGTVECYKSARSYTRCNQLHWPIQGKNQL